MEEAGARLQDLWNGILDLTSKLVIPDWGSLVALLPILLLAVVVLFFAGTLLRLTQLGPRRRGVRRLPPLPPPGVHEGHGSFAPILAAIGAAVVFAGLVLKGWFLIGGLAVLAIALLYWGREALREYDQVEGRVQSGTAVALAPPPGVHMPAPSFRPILVSAAVALLFAGLVAGPWIALAGFLFLVVSLLGWLRDARHEYADVVTADRTGQLPHAEAPGYPVGTLAVIAVILVGAIVLDAGILPPKGSAAGGPGASPGASAPAGGGGSGGSASGGAPSTAPSGGAGGDVTIEAKGIAFVQASVSAPAGKAFTIAFDNQDAGIPHNVDVHDASGGSAFKGEIVTGVTQTTYDVPALQAGTYTFVCDVHPSMTGTLTVK
ncbi:MAG TPA: cupredoxin domain-containing protein [Candidatus Limnocylindrales bacterium]|nr:cupredoxin domain-containing protein [Candidatus Limnocylindrales bacterium]